jgi:hypothetical protein
MMFETDPANFTPTLTSDRREAITAVRFACETHNAPGECDIECANLISAMSGGDGIDFDPTGCSYGPPRAWTGYRFDAEARASIEVTYTPVELLDDTTYDLLFS